MSNTMFARDFKVVVVSLVAVFSVCALVFVLSGVATLFRQNIFGGDGPAGGGGGTSSFAFSVSMSYLKAIAVAVIVLIVGLFGLTRIRRFLR